MDSDEPVGARQGEVRDGTQEKKKGENGVEGLKNSLLMLSREFLVAHNLKTSNSKLELILRTLR